MKRFITTVIATTIIGCTSLTSTYANDVPPICFAFGGVAEAVMTLRQQNRDLEEIINQYNQMASGMEDEVHDYGLKVLMDAHQQPLFSSEEGKRRAILDYKNASILECYKTYKP